MYTKLMSLAFLFFSFSLVAQNQEETLFRKARLSGGFAAPMFSYSSTNGHSVYGAGGGVGMVFNQFFAGFFGMGETFSAPRIQDDRLALGYGGLWMGYTVPTHKLVHLYGSVKIAGGAVGVTNFNDDWNFDENVDDAVFVGIPEVGVELNVARWFRISGTAGYRFVGGFQGWNTVGKNDLNRPVFGLTMRFGWFGTRQ